MITMHKRTSGFINTNWSSGRSCLRSIREQQSLESKLCDLEQPTRVPYCGDTSLNNEHSTKDQPISEVPFGSTTNGIWGSSWQGEPPESGNRFQGLVSSSCFLYSATTDENGACKCLIAHLHLFPACFVCQIVLCAMQSCTCQKRPLG